VKIEKLMNGKIPVYEPEQEDMVKRNSESGDWKFTTSLADDRMVGFPQSRFRRNPANHSRVNFQ